MKTTTSIQERLAELLPEGTLPLVLDAFAPYEVELRITKPRRTKFGDYRPPVNHPHHRISINNDLNPYHFIITLLHELAHLTTWEMHQNKVKPHGQEWKAEFQRIMAPVMKAQLLPTKVTTALEHYMSNPKASSCTDQQLMKVLKEYDKKSPTLFLEDLPENAIFSINRKRFFQKGAKQRTRFKCLDLQNKKYYLVNGIAEVEHVVEQPAALPVKKQVQRRSWQLRLFGG